MLIEVEVKVDVEVKVKVDVDVEVKVKVEIEDERALSPSPSPSPSLSPSLVLLLLPPGTIERLPLGVDLALDGDDDPPRPAVVAVLVQVEALRTNNGDRQRRS